MRATRGPHRPGGIERGAFRSWRSAVGVRAFASVALTVSFATTGCVSGPDDFDRYSQIPRSEFERHRRGLENLQRIPPGVEDGTALRVQGAGEAGERGAPAGDLYVVVHVKADKRFERDGDDLVMQHHISVPLAALGGETEVETWRRRLSRYLRGSPKRAAEHESEP